jgi:hypothetical protein
MVPEVGEGSYTMLGVVVVGGEQLEVRGHAGEPEQHG